MRKTLQQQRKFSLTKSHKNTSNNNNRTFFSILSAITFVCFMSTSLTHFGLVLFNNNDNEDYLPFATWQEQQRHNHINASELIQMASNIHKTHNVVTIQLLNAGYITMTKSWICNVQQVAPDILNKTLFITTDETAFHALSTFGTDKINTTLNVVHVPYNTPTSMSYGEYDYYNFMLFRTNLISSLLISNNLTVWLVESDAAWFHNPTSIVLNTSGDIVTGNDAQPGCDKLLQGGFLLLRPTMHTKTAWTMLQEKFSKTLHRIAKYNNKQFDDLDGGSEQLMLNKIIYDVEGLEVGWLDSRQFVPGVYYSDYEFRVGLEDANLTVVWNNYIIGNDAKIERAKEWDHWYLDEEGDKCLSSE